MRRVIVYPGTSTFMQTAVMQIADKINGLWVLQSRGAKEPSLCFDLLDPELPIPLSEPTWRALWPLELWKELLLNHD